jgi:hypothetical protein
MGIISAIVSLAVWTLTYWRNSVLYQKKLIKSFLLILLTLLILSACSKQVDRTDGFINCNNGTSPTPIEQNFKFPGDLLFMRSDGSELLAFNGETHEWTSVLHMPSGGDYAVSPLSRDGKTLVISYKEPSELETLSIMLLSYRGSIEYKKANLPSLEANRNKAHSWFPVHWINSDYLQGVLSEEVIPGERLWESWLLNPYQSEWKSLPRINNNLDQAEGSGFSISPDLTRVLYVNNEYHLILYDLNQNKVLWEYSDYDGVIPQLTSPTLSNAIWSKNGALLALPVADKDREPGILILDNNGKIINSISFGNYQHGFSWAEDGQLVAFYEDRCSTIDCMDRVRPVIRIIDMRDGLLRDLCSLGEDIVPTQGTYSGRLIWSPDQQFLTYTTMITHWEPPSEALNYGIILQKLNDPQIRIIHIEKHAMILVGWSKYHWTSADLRP